MLNTSLYIKNKAVVIISRFNYFINKSLLNSVLNTIKLIANININSIDTIWVSGSNEIATIVNSLLYKNKYNIILPIGTVIRGDSFHFNIVAKNCSLNYNNIIIKHKLTITAGILIVDNIEQALERSESKAGNKGSESIATILELVNTMKTHNLK